MGKSLGSIFVGLGLDAEAFTSGLKSSQAQMRTFGKDVGKIGSQLSKSLSIPTGAIAGGIAFFGKQFDGALSNLQRKTGQTGKDFKILGDQFVNIFANGDDSIAEVGEALGAVAAKTGLAGKPLEDLSNTILDLVDVTGKDLNTVLEGSTTVLKNWGVATTDNTKALDYLLKVSQTTGASFDSITGTMATFGSTLRTVGLNFNDSAALIGSLTKAGVDTEKVLNGVKLSINNFMEAGLNPAEAFKSLVAQIKNADEATGNMLAKTNTNGKVFLDFANAVRKGGFEIGGIKEKIGNADGAIKQFAEASQTFGQKLSQLFNPFIAILAKVGKDIIEYVSPALDSLIKMAQELSSYIRDNVSPDFLKWTGIIIGLAAAAGPALLALKGFLLVLAGFPTVIGLIITAFKGLAIAMLATPFGILATIVTGGIYVWANYKEAVVMTWEDIVFAVKRAVALVASEVEYVTTLLAEYAKGNLEGGTAARGAADSYLALEFAKATKTYNENTKAILAVGVEQEKTAGKIKTTNDAVKDGADNLGDLNLNLGESAKKAKDLQKEWTSLTTSFQNNTLKTDLGKEIDKSIKDMNQADFGIALDKLKAQIRQEKFTELTEKFGSAVSAAEIGKQVEAEVTEAAKDYKEKFTEAEKQAHKEGIDFWRSTFENAITGVKFDLKDMLQQIAVGFAAQMAQAITGSMGGILQGVLKPQDLGGKIADSIMGGLNLGSLFGGGVSGVGPIANGAEYAGNILGKSASTTMAGMAEKWGLTAGSALGLAGMTYIIGSNAIKNNALKAIQGKGNTQSNIDLGLLANNITMGLNPILGGLGKGSIGGLFGGKGNKETKARNDFVNAINDMVKTVAGGSILMKDAMGEWKNIKDPMQIFGGSKKFNDGGGFDFINSLDEKTKGVFNGLGTAFKEIFKLDDLDFSQAGALLSESMGGSIDNLRSLVFGLKLNFEDTKKVMLDSAEQGKMSWAEYNSTIAGLGEAFKPGLSAVGDLTGAVKELAASGGIGLKAVKGVKDIAVEAMEQGATKVSELEAALIKAGRSSEEASKIAQGFAQSGQTSLKAIADGSNEIAGQIAGNIANAGFAYQDISKSLQEVGKSISGINDIKLNPKVLEIQVKATGDTNLVANTGIDKAANGGIFTNLTKFASGGIVNSPTFFNHSRGVGLMGEAGSEAILPLTRVGGQLGVNASGIGGGKTMPSGTFVFNIDATNAQTGVSSEIINALELMRESILNDAINIISRSR